MVFPVLVICLIRNCESSFQNKSQGYYKKNNASCQSHLGSQKLESRLKFLIASHLENHILGRITPGTLPIPVWTMFKISDGFLLGILTKILKVILPNTGDHRFMKCTRWDILSIPFVTQSFKLRQAVDPINPLRVQNLPTSYRTY